MRERLFDDCGRVQFAGHETFPLRLLWLKKAYDAVRDGITTAAFLDPSAIARFGVGRNMAASMRHWAIASRLIVERDRRLTPSPEADLILADDGFDPYLEHPATVWLAHWGVASTAEQTTTAYLTFNGLVGAEFDSSALVAAILREAGDRGWRTSPGTLRRDVEVMLRSYVRKSGAAAGEEAAEPLFAELGLIQEGRFGGRYELVRSERPSLPDGVFAYAIRAFASRASAATLSVEQVAYAPGSPGQVFKLDEDAVVSRLIRLPALTGGAWRWTDTAGLRQLQIIDDVDGLDLLASAYGSVATRMAA